MAKLKPELKYKPSLSTMGLSGEVCKKIFEYKFGWTIIIKVKKEGEGESILFEEGGNRFVEEKITDYIIPSSFFDLNDQFEDYYGIDTEELIEFIGKILELWGSEERYKTNHLWNDEKVLYDLLKKDYKNLIRESKIRKIIE